MCLCIVLSCGDAHETSNVNASEILIHFGVCEYDNGNEIDKIRNKIYNIRNENEMNSKKYMQLCLKFSNELNIFLITNKNQYDSKL